MCGPKALRNVPSNLSSSSHFNIRKSQFLSICNQFFVVVLVVGIASTLDKSRVSKKCRPYVLPFLCYHNLPYCVKGQMKPKKLCQQSCIILRWVVGVLCCLLVLFVVCWWCWCYCGRLGWGVRLETHMLYFEGSNPVTVISDGGGWLLSFQNHRPVIKVVWLVKLS